MFSLLYFVIGCVYFALPVSSTSAAIEGAPNSLTAGTWTQSHGQDSLEIYSRRSDCFRKVTASMKSRCSELALNEEERVVSAISMTLCELATAKHHAPMECRGFSGQYEDGSDSPADCVNALSRSAQFWSSYSGYLREVPQLCFTFQRGNDIDDAKDVFRNISLNQELFLRMIIDRERMHAMQTERWSSNVDDLANLTGQLLFLSRTVQTESSDAVAQVRRDSTEALDVISTSFAEFRTQIAQDRVYQLAKIDSDLEGLSDRHMRELQGIVPQVEASLLSFLGQTFQLAHQRQEAIVAELTTTTQGQWRVIYSEFAAMQEAISQLSLSATETVYSLDSLSKQTAHDIHQALLLVSHTANQLGGVLDDLTGRALEQMEVIDGVAAELKEKLVPPPQLPPSSRGGEGWFSYESVSSDRWWRGIVVRILGWLLGGSPLSAWIDSPFFKILEIVGAILFWLLRRSLSTVTSFVVICFSCRKYIQRILRASESASSDPEKVPAIDWAKRGSFEAIIAGFTDPDYPHFAPQGRKVTQIDSNGTEYDSLYPPLPLPHRYHPRRHRQGYPDSYSGSNGAGSGSVEASPQYQYKSISGRWAPPTAVTASRYLAYGAKTSRIPDRLCRPGSG